MLKKDKNIPIVCDMATDDLAIEGARSSAPMVLT